MNGAEANTWENNGDWVSNVRFHYRINTSAGEVVPLAEPGAGGFYLW